MSPLIETMARAICKDRRLNPDCLHQHHEGDSDYRNLDRPWPTDAVLTHGKLAHYGWRHFTSDVVAALRAAAPVLREDAMAVIVAEAICQTRYEMTLKANGGAMQREFMKEGGAAINAIVSLIEADISETVKI